MKGANNLFPDGRCERHGKGLPCPECSQPECADGRPLGTEVSAMFDEHGEVHRQYAPEDCLICKLQRGEYATGAMSEPASVPTANQEILVMGDPVDGFTYFGPFRDELDVVAWTERNDLHGDPWWVANLQSVTRDDEDAD